MSHLLSLEAWCHFSRWICAIPLNYDWSSTYIAKPTLVDCFPILAHLISHYVSNYASILYTVPVLHVLPIIHVCTRPVANKERNFRNPWFLPGIQTRIASNFDLLVSNCQGKEIPSFLSVSYLISESWDAFNIRFVILGTERCYASVIILRKAIGRAKNKQKKVMVLNGSVEGWRNKDADSVSISEFSC